MKKILTLFSLLFASVLCLAQGTFVNSCLVGNVLYTNPDTRFSNAFNDTPVKTLSSGYCDWTPRSGSVCYICLNGSFNNGGNCNGGGTQLISGIQGTFSMVACPVDDNSMLAIISLLITSVFIVKLKR